MINRISYILTYAMLYIVALIPLNILYIISSGAHFFVCHILRYRKTTIRKNLTYAFPDKTKKEIRKIEKKFYLHICDLFVETVKLLHISNKEMRKRVNIYGCDIVEDLAKQDIPIFVYLSHYGNWEWAQEVKKCYIRPKITAEIYHHIANPVINRIMLKIRSRWNGMLFSQNEAVRNILTLRKTGKSFLIGFISDQRPHHAEDNQWITFLNQPTDMVCGAEILGKRCNAAFLYLDINKVKRGHYHMTFMHLQPSDECRTPYPYTETYMHKLEQTVKECPEYWLWSHKRWAHADSIQRIIKQ
ncbi:lipd A biosynthesis protein [Prevotella sp. PCHR]|uniref:Lipd A biosynthesis protein n=1 Tax=Xylanibacter caecicola TaxID=2736294 RepID=A0ABX2B5I2_9BACT|nr:lysophospholipid acyltransferase family protein [Xylanibacter caecicola]NPE25235.1 lipd A biosynthesis protein [Xylanibacter caecicola]